MSVPDDASFPGSDGGVSDIPTLKGGSGGA